MERKSADVAPGTSGKENEKLSWLDLIDPMDFPGDSGRAGRMLQPGKEEEGAGQQPQEGQGPHRAATSNSASSTGKSQHSRRTDGVTSSFGALQGSRSSAEDETFTTLRTLRSSVNRFPFPFASTDVETEYLQFCSPAGITPPLWGILFIIYASGPLTNNPPDIRHNGIGHTIRMIRLACIGSASIVVLCQVVSLALDRLLAWHREREELLRYLRHRKEQRETEELHQRPIANKAGGGYEQGRGGDGNSHPRFSGLLGPELEALMKEDGSLSMVDPAHNHNEGAYSRMTQVTGDGVGSISWFGFPWFRYYLRVLLLYLIFLESVAGALESWNCHAESQDPRWIGNCLSRASTMITFFVSSLILRVSLNWELPRLFGFATIQTVLANTPSIRTQPGETRLSLLFLLWTVTFVFIGVEWEAERESRLRFLSSKLLALMQVRAQERKETIVATLKSFSFTGPQLHQFLEGQPILEESDQCAVLITTIHDYPLWRQQTTVTMALNCLDQYFRNLDKMRRSFSDVHPVSISGDSYIVSTGLSDSRPSSKNRTEILGDEPSDGDQGVVASLIDRSDDALDLSELVHFGYRQLSLGRVLSSGGAKMLSGKKSTMKAKDGKGKSAEGEVSPLAADDAFFFLFGSIRLKLGFGVGSCSGALIPRRGAHYVLNGEAFLHAKANHELARPDSLELPKQVLRLCPGVTITHQRIQDGRENGSGSRTLLFHRHHKLHGRDVAERVRVTNVRTKKNIAESVSLGELRATVGSGISQTSNPLSMSAADVRMVTSEDDDPSPPHPPPATLVGSGSGEGHHEYSEAGTRSSAETAWSPPLSAGRSGHSVSALVLQASNATPRSLEGHNQDSQFFLDSSHQGGSGGCSSRSVKARMDLESLAGAPTESTSTSFMVSAEAQAMLAMAEQPNHDVNTTAAAATSNTSPSTILNTSTTALLESPSQRSRREEVAQDISTLTAFSLSAFIRMWFVQTFSALKILFNPFFDEGFCAFVDRRLTRRIVFITSCWFALWMGFLIPYLSEEGYTTPSLAYLLGALAVQIASFPGLFICTKLWRVRWLRWYVFIAGALQYGLIIAAAVEASPFSLSFARWFPELIWNFIFCMTSTDGIPLVLSLVVSLGLHTLTSAFREFTSRSGAALVVSFAPPIILVVTKASLIRHEYRQVQEVADRQRYAHLQQQKHETVLNMLLPSYIVAHIVNLEVRGHGGAVSEALADEAVLLIQFPVFEKIDVLLHWNDVLQEIVGDRSQQISLIHTDGDIVMVSGPLMRPKIDPQRLPYSITQCNTGYFRQQLENVANQASLDLVNVYQRFCQRFNGQVTEAQLPSERRLSSSASNGAPPPAASTSHASLTAVLHRGDGFAVVFRHRCPTFSVEGKVTEVAMGLLRSLEVGTVCLTHPFLELYPGDSETLRTTFNLKRASAPPEANTGTETGTSGKSSENFCTVQYRIRGLGFVSVASGNSRSTLNQPN